MRPAGKVIYVAFGLPTPPPRRRRRHLGPPLLFLAVFLGTVAAARGCRAPSSPAACAARVCP